MVVVLVGALLGSCQLSLQLLDLVAVRQQLVVVAVNLAGPVAKCVMSVPFSGSRAWSAHNSRTAPLLSGGLRCKWGPQVEGFSFAIYTAITPGIRTLR